MEHRSDDSLRDHLFPIFISCATAVSRALTSGPAYFGDAEFHLAVIRNHTYLIQPPGYWLFNRLVGMWPNPEIAMISMNWLFSGLGVFFFYNASRRLFDVYTSRLGTLTYSTIFFAWFSGSVHSTYASQLFFPVVMFYLFLVYRDTKALPALLGAAVMFAIGAGFRPSDGAFLLPFFCYMVFRESQGRSRWIALTLAACLCLLWVYPTLQNDDTVYSQIASVARQSSMVFSAPVNGIEGNFARFVIPLVFAFWPLSGLLPRALNVTRELHIALLLWLLPGFVFFLFIYISDAPYFNYLAPAILFLAMAASAQTSPAVRSVSFLSCAIWNCIFFLFFVPSLPASLTTSRSKAIAAVEVYSGKYTSWAIQHQWQPRLSELLAPRIN